MTFSHVIKHYVIHGGDSQGLGAAEEWISKGKLRGQLNTRFVSQNFLCLVSCDVWHSTISIT